MFRYILTCKSLTYAQKMANVLKKSGVSAQISRVPTGVTTSGCGYCVIIPERHYYIAIEVLKKEKIAPNKIFINNGGMYSEVYI